ncbi:HDOD domain-containing protein [bacterium]|nr:HDOD domain-containing protein [bacterium]
MTQTDNEILRHLDKVRDFPTLPRVVTRLNEAVASPHTSTADVACILQDDPAVSAKLLRLVNSAFYARGNRSEITSVPFAVARLGFREVRNLVMTLSVFSQFQQKSSVLDLPNFWRHSISVAVASRVVHGFAVNSGEHTPPAPEPDGEYACGLLHDMGLLVLSLYFPQKLRDVLKQHAQSGYTLHAVEEEMLGVTHATLGGFVARMWQLPEFVAIAIENHHTPDQAPESARRLSYVVQLADYVCNLHWPAHTVEAALGEEQKHLAAVKALGIRVKQIPEILDLVGEEASRSQVIVALG